MKKAFTWESFNLLLFSEDFKKYSSLIYSLRIPNFWEALVDYQTLGS